MYRFNINPIKQLGIISCLLFSTSALADSSYQLSASVAASKIDFEGLSGNADAYGASLEAYLEPVVLNDEMPYFVAPFYQRVSGLSFDYAKTDAKELNLALGGQVLTSSESDLISVGAWLARKEIPIWLGLNYTEVESDLVFNNGQSTASTEGDSVSAQLGWYITNRSNIFIFYVDDNEEDSYGIGGSVLLSLSESGDIEPFFVYEHVDVPAPDLQVINNVIRNADINPSAEDIWTAGVNYYPNVKTFLGFRYTKERDSKRDLEARFTRFSGGYYITDNLVISGSYSRFSTDDTSFSNRLDSDSYSLSASFKF